MAPALTEPLSPTENLTKSAVTATTTPTTRSSRKLESSIANKSGINNTTNTTAIREKRNRSGGSATVNQTPTSSKRITRSKDNQQRSPVVTPTSPSPKEDNTEKETQQNTNTSNTTKVVESVKEIDTSSINNSNNNNNTNKNSPCTKNEQMGLSTAPLNNKNKILNNNNANNNNNNISSTSEEDLATIKDNTKDTSTAQLLADLTNEAITAEICLRNQLKDVNLVKTSGGDPSSPIIQQEDTFVDSDILVLKAVASSPTIVAEPVINKTTSAHMEAQFIEESSKSTSTTTATTKVQETTSTTAAAKVEATTATSETELTATESISPAETATENEIIPSEDDKQKALEEKADVKEEPPVTEVNNSSQQHGNENEHKQEKSLDAAAVATTESYMDTVHETPVGSPNSCEDGGVGTEETKKSGSKLEILSVQELPPVSTDSTMTASEVEDNLEGKYKLEKLHLLKFYQNISIK